MPPILEEPKAGWVAAIALAFTIVGGLFSGVFSGGEMKANLSVLQDRVTKLELMNDKLDDLKATVARIEGKLDSQEQQKREH